MIEVMRRTQFDPAKIHGHLKMELFDASKQLIQKVEKDNLVTNALKYMLNNVAGGVPSQLSALLMPVATKGLGGLMLFSDVLDEDADNVLFPFQPNHNGDFAYLVASAGRGTNTGNVMAGSLNGAESGPTDRGYTSVWDFGTSQANGSIKSAALTLRSDWADTQPFRSAVGYSLYAAHNIRKTNGDANFDAQPLYYDLENQVLYFTSANSGMGYSVSSVYDPQTRVTTYTYTMAIYATYLPMQSYKVGDCVDGYWLPTFVRSISWQDTVSYTPEFKPGYDGYAYFTYSPGNSSGTGSLRYLALHTDDKSFTMSNMQTISVSEAYFSSGQSSVIASSYLWVLANSKTGVYRINRSNPANVDFYQFPEGHYASEIGRLCRGDGINLMLYCPAANGQAGYYDQYDAMIYPDGAVLKNGGYFTRNNVIYGGGSYRGTQMLYEFEKLWAWGSRSANSNSFSHACYGIPYARYLGTIANLSSTIVKNATQTLKVTYTLTDE